MTLAHSVVVLLKMPTMLHATVSCTKATSLRNAMRTHWTLPHERGFAHTGKDWLLVCLNQVNSATKARILLILWRAWHLRNDAIHRSGKESIRKSVSFLLSYSNCRHLATIANSNGKGKEPLFEAADTDRVSATAPRLWMPPPPGWIKLNTDASFIVQDKPNAVGAIT
jgi:hypothetical protein